MLWHKGAGVFLFVGPASTCEGGFTVVAGQPTPPP